MAHRSHGKTHQPKTSSSSKISSGHQTWLQNPLFIVYFPIKISMDKEKSWNFNCHVRLPYIIYIYVYSNIGWHQYFDLLNGAMDQVIQFNSSASPGLPPGKIDLQMVDVWGNYHWFLAGVSRNIYMQHCGLYSWKKIGLSQIVSLQIVVYTARLSLQIVVFWGYYPNLFMSTFMEKTWL